MWFGINWDYLPVVWNLTLYSREVSKNIIKYVILLYFYIFSLKNTKIRYKNTKSNKIKNNIAKHSDFKTHESNLNFNQFKISKMSNFKLQISNLNLEQTTDKLWFALDKNKLKINK